MSTWFVGPLQGLQTPSYSIPGAQSQDVVTPRRPGTYSAATWSLGSRAGCGGQGARNSRCTRAPRGSRCTIMEGGTENETVPGLSALSHNGPACGPSGCYKRSN